MFGAWGTNNAHNAGNNAAQVSTGGFGAMNAFGQPAQQQTGGFGAAPQAGSATPQGTANPPYAEPQERDSSATNVMLHYHSISCMPAYINHSPEELRVQDYAVGRKNASSTGFGGTVNTGFGTTPTTTGAFGHAATPAAGGAFGGFGAAGTGGGLFGANPFSANNGQMTTNPFGHGAAAPANPFSANTGQTTGGFGAGGAFGATNNNNAGGAFNTANNNAPKPFGFGSSDAGCQVSS